MLRQISVFRNMSNSQAYFYEKVTGLLRLLFLIVSCLFIADICIHWLEGAKVGSLADQMRQDPSSLFFGLPKAICELFVPFQNWQYFRYVFAPFGGFLLVFLNSVFYVEDIYHLPNTGRAFHYVLASLFSFFYPVAEVEGGRINDEDPDDENNLENRNLLQAVGGPGFVRIQPGNVIAFRDWHTTRDIQDNQLYFMRPFEMIARVANLEDQHGHIEDSSATTQDGIRLRLKNIDYRFAVLRTEPEKKDVQAENQKKRNQVLQRSQEKPYPFSKSAIQSIAYSFSVSDRGLDTWHETVKRAVEGALGTFISNHDLDYLTAPWQDGQNPRRELRVELFAPAVSGALRKVGTELYWMDIGQFDIDNMKDNQEQDPVNEARTKFWAARWIGDANTLRSYGEAKHLMYQELGRAEAQAEMIMSIIDALRNISLGANSAETLRQIFLARTAQIFEALRDGNTRKEPPK